MRIPIREQLGLLVLLTSLFALAVVAVATVRYACPSLFAANADSLVIQWINNYNFVVDIR